MEPIYIRTDKNGTKIYEDWTCPRCGGAGGADCWAYTGWKCYECGGSGRAHKPQIIKVYTEEYQKKLNERNAKRLEKKRQEALANVGKNIEKLGFGKEGESYAIYRVVGNTFSIRETLKLLGCKYDSFLGWYSSKDLEGYETQRLTFDEIAHICDNGYVAFNNYSDIQPLLIENIRKEQRAKELAESSNHIGNIGDKITIDCVAKCVGHWTTSFYGHEVYTYKYILNDKEGNQYVWTTSSGSLPEGEEITVKATVKEHSEYNGIKQTVIKNCKKVGGAE